MTTTTVEPPPVWKKNSTAEERLLELSHIARNNPEQFSKFMVIYQEVNEEIDSTFERVNCFNLTTMEAVGLMRYGEFALLDQQGQDTYE